MIKIFGKSEFDKLRRKKQLKFLQTNADFTQFEEKRKETKHISQVEIFKNFL